MSRARILHLHSSFDLGGKEARTVQLMNHFGDAARHTILVGDMSAMGARGAIDASLDVAFPGDKAPSLLGKPSIFRYRKIARYMQDFDLILSYNWGSMDGVMTHRLFGGAGRLPALIHHEDGFNEDERDKLNWKRNLFRSIALGRSYATVVPSQTLADIAQNIWHQPPEKIRHFPNGIAIEKYTQKPSVSAFPGFVKNDGDILVGTIAGLRAVKNLPLLVRAVAASGKNIRLAIAGEGPERPAIEAEAEKLGIKDRVMMPGFLKDPSRFVGLFDIFALSSDSEQYPISLVEAMAAGLPAVATNVGDVRNMVTPGNMPYIVPAGDEAALAAAIGGLASDGLLRRQIGKENQRHAAANYHEDNMFASYAKLYGKAMNLDNFAGHG